MTTLRTKRKLHIYGVCPLFTVIKAWAGFPQDFGAFLWPIHPVEHLLKEKAWLAISVPVHPKGFLMGLRSGLCVSESSSSTPNSSNHDFMDVALCTGVHVEIEKGLP